MSVKRVAFFLVRPYLVEHKVERQGCTYVAKGNHCDEYRFPQGPFTVLGRRSRLLRSSRDNHFCQIPATYGTLLNIHRCPPSVLKAPTIRE